MQSVVKIWSVISQDKLCDGQAKDNGGGGNDCKVYTDSHFCKDILHDQIGAYNFYSVALLKNIIVTYAFLHKLIS